MTPGGRLLVGCRMDRGRLEARAELERGERVDVNAARCRHADGCHARVWIGDDKRKHRARTASARERRTIEDDRAHVRVQQRMRLLMLVELIDTT